jgi:hypothetical protein
MVKGVLHVCAHVLTPCECVTVALLRRHLCRTMRHSLLQAC